MSDIVSEDRIVEPTSNPYDLGDSIEVTLNDYPIEENRGEDLYIASVSTYPGILAFGADRELASLRLREAVSELLATASENDVRRVQSVQALVQFNQRITADEKLRIMERAQKAGLSVRQFVLNQCLYAQVFRVQPGMPPERKGEILNKIKLTAERSTSEKKSAR